MTQVCGRHIRRFVYDSSLWTSRHTSLWLSPVNAICNQHRSVDIAQSQSGHTDPWPLSNNEHCLEERHLLTKPGGRCQFCWPFTHARTHIRTHIFWFVWIIPYCKITKFKSGKTDVMINTLAVILLVCDIYTQMSSFYFTFCVCVRVCKIALAFLFMTSLLWTMEKFRFSHFLTYLQLLTLLAMIIFAQISIIHIFSLSMLCILSGFLSTLLLLLSSVWFHCVLWRNFKQFRTLRALRAHHVASLLYSLHCLSVHSLH